MNHDAHTLREFDAALSSLNTHLLQMAYKAQSALDLAAAGLCSRMSLPPTGLSLMTKNWTSWK